MSETPKLSACGEIVRRHDRDRFFTALYAPVEQREHLFTLYAFNVELAKIRDVVTETMLGRIRLQWWRESLDGLGTPDQRNHEVVVPLGALLAQGRVDRSDLTALIDAREADLEAVQPENLAVLEAYIADTSARLTKLAAKILGADGEDAMRAAHAAGMAYGLIGVVRAIVHHAHSNRLMLPAAEAERHGMKKSDALELRGSDGLSAVTADLARRAEGYLAEARGLRRAVPKSAVAALLPGSLAGQYLSKLRKVGNNPFDARFGLARPGVLGLMFRAVIGRY